MIRCQTPGSGGQHSGILQDILFRFCSSPSIEELLFRLSGGNTFLTLTKTNRSNSVTQLFGFYHKYTLKASALMDMTSAIKDDPGHEINAGIRLNVSGGNFDNVMTYIINHSGNDYNLSGYNFTDFAPEAFNTMLSALFQLIRAPFIQGILRLTYIWY